MGYAFGGSSIKDDKYLNKTVNQQNKNKSKNKPNSKNQIKSLQKKLNTLQSIDKPSGSERAKIIALKRRIKNLKNPKDAETIAQVVQKNKQKVKSQAEDRHRDWKKMRKGDIKKEKFIKDYPESQTAKKHNLKIKKDKPTKKNKRKPLFSFTKNWHGF